jgi:hypothetical protein
MSDLFGVCGEYPGARTAKIPGGRRKYPKGRRCEASTSRCSSGVEHFLGKEEVVSSILINGSVNLDEPEVRRPKAKH